MARTIVNRLASAALVFSTLSEMIFPFLRTVVLARLLPPDQVGIGVTLSVVYGIAEQVSDIGLTFSAIRSSELAPQRTVYATLHSIQMLRGLLLGLLLLAAAPVFAYSFSTPEALWAYAMLGLCMVLRALYNLSIKEAVRSYAYWREAVVVGGAQLVWTIATAALAWWLQDFRAAIYGILINIVAFVLLSHLFSVRRWRLGWDKPVAAEALAFGRPLMKSGIGNAILQFSDRFAVGTLLGMAPLAIYNITMLTAMLPRNVVVRLFVTLYMPPMVNFGRERAKTEHLNDSWTLCLAVLGFGCGIGLISIGAPVIGLTFGLAYQPETFVMNLIAIFVCARFFDQLPIPPGLSFGETKFIFHGTVAIALSVVGAIAVMYFDPVFEHFLVALVAGEILVVIWIIRRSIPMFGLTPAFTWFLLFLSNGVLILLAAIREFFDWNLTLWIAVSWATGLVTIAIMLLAAHRTGLNFRTLIVSIKDAKKKPAIEAQDVAPHG